MYLGKTSAFCIVSIMITVYEKSTCTKCRQTKKILDEAKVAYELVSYYETGISVELLKELLQKLDMSPRELLRTGEQVYRDLGLAKKDLSFDELIKIMSENPDLIQRPIVVKGNRAVLGRPPENVQELLS